ncbi:hypothetical protein FNV43_RR12243 [Rhamnella rubrinervis]|uniref:BZIP domain-containing protein n=1 Tax=Rhamnella rubrinervis TaxID=2594499 RepID=A0A8K0H7K8_9ROSA|nr:hypothetical protein FNV43_RR12243 [Rhamnella rubrinervis]
MPKDEWMRAAMTDDMLVVELLVRLKQSQASSPLKSPPPAQTSMFPLTWSVRMPRSKSARCDAVSQRKRGGDSTRCSPTTPLSWSGGASPSGGTADEESSRPTNRSSSSSHPRSKGANNANEFATNTSTSATKGSRRKKTFAELKEEEGSLLKERIYLKKELATLRATFKEKRAENESLKRMKLDFELHSAENLKANIDGLEKAIHGQLHQTIIASSTCDNVLCNLLSRTTPDDYDNNPQQLDSRDASSKTNLTQNSFVLPDLNMVPSEDDYGPEAFCGLS